MVFFRGIRGYLWIFPRTDRASVGIVARPGEASAADLRRRVAAYLEKSLPRATVVGSYGWVIPAPAADGRPPVPVLAEGVALVGDAAGIVDPITGEGIYYALASSRLLAEAILRGRLAEYPARVEETIVPELSRSGRWAERYFNPRVLETVLAAAGRSARVRTLIADLVSGRQRYATLPERILSSPGGRLLAAVFRTFLAA